MYSKHIFQWANFQKETTFLTPKLFLKFHPQLSKLSIGNSQISPITIKTVIGNLNYQIREICTLGQDLDQVQAAKI